MTEQTTGKTSESTADAVASVPAESADRSWVSRLAAVAQYQGQLR